MILGTFRIKKKEIEQRRYAADDASVNALQGRCSWSFYAVFIVFTMVVKATAFRNCTPSSSSKRLRFRLSTGSVYFAYIKLSNIVYETVFLVIYMYFWT